MDLSKYLAVHMNDKDLKEDNDSDSGEMRPHVWCKIGDQAEIRDRASDMC